MAYDDIASEISDLSRNISEVSSQIDNISVKVDGIESELQELSSKFDDYLDKYVTTTELQLSETRIINVRQQMVKEYGHYDEVRRHTTGILQAMDAGLVRQATIKQATEELMLATPRYWLTPCLIALSSWINDDKAHAEKAMNEAVRRNDEKTSLFFSLVCRRGTRYNASRMWLDRYLGMQDPTALPIDMVVVIDAYSNGIFGPDVDGLCIKRLEGWIDTLSARPGFEDRQKAQWKNALQSFRRPAMSDEFTYLKQYSPSWPLLQKSLSGAVLHMSAYNHFSSIFDERVEPASGITGAVDDILDNLISEYDADELALRKEERLLALIIDENGDKKAAQRRFDLEKDTVNETVDITQVLTNAAIHPEVVHSSRAGQRLAVALSKEWILLAHGELTAENRASLPHMIEFTIDQWSGTTVDGENEDELIESTKPLFKQEISKALVNVSIDPIRWVAAVIGAGLLLAGAVTLNAWAIIPGAAGLIWFYLAKRDTDKKKHYIKSQILERRKQTISIIKALLAEVIDWKSAYKLEDQHAEEFKDLIKAISPEQYVGSSYDTGRTVMKFP